MIEKYIDILNNLIMKMGLSEELSTGIAETTAAISLVILSFAIFFLIKFILKLTVYKIIQLSTNKFDDLLVKNKVIGRICLLIPALIIGAWLPDVLPSFPGGEQALMTWLRENLKYPQQAMKEHATGRVLVNFVINTDGSIDEVKILRSVHPVLNEEAMRVIKEMPKWQPGMKDGKVVRVRFTMPITFSLNMNPPQMGN